MTWRALALTIAVLPAACGAPPPTLDLAPGRDVSLTLTLRETLSWRGSAPSKLLRLSLRGSARTDGAAEVLETEVAWAELTYVAGDGRRVELATDGTRDDPGGGDPLSLARRGLLEGLVGRRVVLRFDPAPLADGGGLESVTGPSAALAASRRELEAVAGSSAAVVDAASGGLEALLDDAWVTASLRAAGLGPAARDVRRRRGELRRTAAVRVDGRGWTDVPLRGSVGSGRGDAPTVRLEGRPPADPAFRGAPGDAPPEAVGAIRVDEIRVSAETEYDPRSMRPQRGSVIVELPHASGPLVRRAAEFLLVVRE